MTHDTNLERGILAQMECDEQSRHIYLSMLKAHHFSGANQEKFVNIEKGIPEQTDIIDSIPGNHEYYAGVLKELYLKRVIQERISKIGHSITSGVGLDEIIPEIETLQKDTALEGLLKGLTITEIEDRKEEHRQFERLDSTDDYGGFYAEAGNSKGQTEVIFGHPKHGKTVYAVHRVCGFLQKGYKGLFITMEDTHLKIMHRIGQQLGHDHPYKDNIILADRSLGAKNLDDISMLLRYHKIVDDIDFAVLDYMQRVPVKGLSSKDDTAKVIEVSNRMTDMANELDLLMLNLAQPHRIEKHRQGWSAFPQVEDLYGSGAIEKDAFVATSVFRPNQIEKLCNFDSYGNVIGVRDWNENEVDRNSVFVKQRLNREAERCSEILQFVHTDNGLQRIKNEQERDAPF